MSGEKVHTWVSHYRLHGIDSLRSKRSVYSTRFKLQRADKHCDMKAQIYAICTEHKERYDYTRIAAALCGSMAQPVNRKRAQRLMQYMGLRSRIRAKTRYRHTHGVSEMHVPNVLKRDSHPTARAQKWLTDIIEFDVKGHKVYLSACVDLYNGEIIAHCMARRLVFELV